MLNMCHQTGDSGTHSFELDSGGSSSDCRQSPPVFYSLNGTPDRQPVPHHLLDNMGRSLDEAFDTSLVYRYEHYPTSHHLRCDSQSSQCNNHIVTANGGESQLNDASQFSPLSFFRTLSRRVNLKINLFCV